jgi:hypothetical protein
MYIHVFEIWLDKKEGDNVLCDVRDKDGEDDLKKNERKRVNLLLCLTACFIDDFELDNPNSWVVVVGLIAVLLSVDDKGIVRDVGNVGTIELY